MEALRAIVCTAAAENDRLNGIDQIVDQDGVGDLYIDDRRITGAGKAHVINGRESLWASSDVSLPKIQYALDLDKRNLKVSAGKYSVILKDFENGHLGIFAPTEGRFQA